MIKSAQLTFALAKVKRSRHREGRKSGGKDASAALPDHEKPGRISEIVAKDKIAVLASVSEWKNRKDPRSILQLCSSN